VIEIRRSRGNERELHSTTPKCGLCTAVMVRKVPISWRWGRWLSRHVPAVPCVSVSLCKPLQCRRNDEIDWKLELL